MRASFVGTVLLVAYALCWFGAISRLTPAYGPLLAYAVATTPGVLFLLFALAWEERRRRRIRRRLIDEEMRR